MADAQTERILAKAAEDAMTKNLRAVVADNQALRKQVGELVSRVERLEAAGAAQRSAFSEFQATAYSSLAATVYTMKQRVEELGRGT